MIPYDELAAALEGWRVRNGLPATPPLFAGPRRAAATAAAPAPVAAYAPPAAAPAPVAYAAPTPIAAPRTAPPSAPPSGRSTMFGVPPPPAVVAAAAGAYPQPTETLDESVDDLIDSDVVEDAHDVYDNEGSDFAVSFGAGKAPATISDVDIDDDERESTQIGATPPPPEAPGAAPWSTDGSTSAGSYGWGQKPGQRPPDDDDDLP